MICDKIFTSFKECIRQVESDFQVDLSNNKSAVLLRGENDLYPKTEPSMRRFLTAYENETKEYIESFLLTSPFIDFQEIYSEYHAELNNLSEIESLGFLQHYGFPTDLIDLSPSIKTAHFFAHRGNADKMYAYIGVFDTSSVSNYYDIVDISNHPYALRPKMQNAWALRHERGIFDFKSKKCDKLFKVHWYKFKKAESDIIDINRNDPFVYPKESEVVHFFSEDVLSIIRSHYNDRKYTNDQIRPVEKKLEELYKKMIKE